MPHFHITHNALGPSPAIPLDLKKFYGAMNASVFLTITGTMTAVLEVTGDDMQYPIGNWVPLGLSGATSRIDTIDAPMSAVRVNVTAYTDGVASLSVVQPEG